MLARVGAPSEGQPQAVPFERAHAPPAADSTERPPMIIERALAEQSGAWMLEARPKPSPWPGLAAGFALSLVAGAGLYAALTGL